jgi:hypothetical protein
MESGHETSNDILSLPPELRITIYEFTLPSNRTISNSEYYGGAYVYQHGMNNTCVFPTYWMPKLLHVSKQIRQEAMPIFFANQPFVYWYLTLENAIDFLSILDPGLLKWLDDISAGVQFMRNLVIDVAIPAVHIQVKITNSEWWTVARLRHPDGDIEQSYREVKKILDWINATLKNVGVAMSPGEFDIAVCPLDDRWAVKLWYQFWDERCGLDRTFSKCWRNAIEKVDSNNGRNCIRTTEERKVKPVEREMQVVARKMWPGWLASSHSYHISKIGIVVLDRQHSPTLFSDVVS